MFQTFKTFLYKSDAKFLVVLSCALVFSFSASAQFAPTPCDPNYYKSLEARAWVEAQREITQNQNLIFKNDSVLEYTCFDNHLRVLADRALDMFSETTRWGTILPNTHMDSALENLISSALVAYDSANFNASLLGGALTATGGWSGAAPSEASGPRYEFEPSISAGSAYACDIMQAVWLKAKCLNFFSVPNSGFYPLDDYRTGSDKRFPAGSCASVASDFDTKLDEALPPIGATTPWEADTVITYFDKFFPTAAGCGSGNNNIPTGLVVEDNSVTPPNYYDEHVCYIQGCFWEPTGTSSNPASPVTAGNCTATP